MNNQCIRCLRGFHEECKWHDCARCHDGSNNYSESDTSSDGDSVEVITSDLKPDPKVSFRRTKPDAALKDQQSTGRKRAARKYPLNREATCEWASRERVGGGASPITGCVSNLQQARHHGPDKNTLNNDEGNVHRICHSCHNNWHAKNDPDYDPNKPLKD